MTPSTTASPPEDARTVTPITRPDSSITAVAPSAATRNAAVGIVGPLTFGTTTITAGMPLAPATGTRSHSAPQIDSPPAAGPSVAVTDPS